MTETPRPQWNHKCVKTAAAKSIFDDVKQWALSMGAIEEDVDPRELQAVIALCIIESADCYDAARYLDSFLDWPVNGELIRIIDRAYMAMPKLTAPFVHEWVMKNKVRFPAKEGDDIKFTIGDAEVSGTVVGVVKREARGFAELRTGHTVPVLAEEVVKVFKTKRPGGRPTPPTGGTPMAPRAGAQLKEKKSA